MKNIKSIFAILFITLLSISCSNNDNETTPLSTEGKFFNAKINGTQFSANVPDFGANKSGNIITIACVQGIHKFQLKITNAIGNGVGTYTIPSTSGNNVVLTYEDDVTTYTSGNCGTTGILTITAISSNEISGTFSYSGQKSGTCPQPQKNISEGTFKAILAGS